MTNRDDFIRVACPKCNLKFAEQIDRLQNYAVLQHNCGARVQCNLNELDKFLREQVYDNRTYLQLHIVA